MYSDNFQKSQTVNAKYTNLPRDIETNDKRSCEKELFLQDNAPARIAGKMVDFEI